MAAPLSLRFDHLGVADGLSQESVTRVLQDRYGYLWIATQAGLNRYDGYRITSFKNNPSNPASLVDNYVQALYEDAHGQLWIGTKGGLDRYERASGHFIHQPSMSPNLSITDITGDGSNGLWLTTSTGLQHLDIATGAMRTLRHVAGDAETLPDDRVNTVLRDPRGNLWVGTAGGLAVLPAGSTRFRRLTPQAAAAPADNIGVLDLGPDGRIWAAGALGLQTWRMNGEHPERLPLGDREALATRRVVAMLHDSQGSQWLALWDGGLLRRDPEQGDDGRYHLYSANILDKNSIADNRVNALYQDRTGTLWIGHWYSGLNRVDLLNGGFERYTQNNGVLSKISNNQVRAIAGAGGDKLWLATADGLTRLDPKRGTSEIWRTDVHDTASVPSNQLLTLATDRQDRLWVGSADGVAWRDPVSGRYTRFKLDADPASKSVQRILVDRGGVIWVGSRAGLHRIDPATLAVTTYRYAADQPDAIDGRIKAMLEDRAGVLWIGTENGLERFDRQSGKFSHYRHQPGQPDSLCHRRVQYLHEDASGGLWVGTGAGLCKAVTGADGRLKFRYYAAREGQASDPVGAILEDAKGRLWISSTGGIDMFDPATGAFKQYTAKDGLLDGSYFLGSGYRARDGAMYFGGVSGLTAFYPSRIHDNPIAPQVAITDFSIFNQSILTAVRREDVLPKGPLDQASKVTLGPHDAMFSIEFAGLHFADPQRNRYAYQLEGFDPQWVLTDSSRRLATYTNLDPGRYVFRVRAANMDGVWSGDPVALEVIITPPFWKQWWFRLLVLALVLGFAYLLFRLRIRRLMRQKQVLENEVVSRTRELVQQKESVEREKREVERQKDSVELAHRNISQLSDIGRRLTANLDSEAIMAMLYQQVHALMDASVFGIGIYRPELSLIEYPFAMEKGKRYTPYTRSMLAPNQLAVWCISHAQEVFINDLEHDYPRYIADLALVTDAEHMGTMEDGSLPSEPRSLIYVPITVSGQVRGVITVHSYRTNAYRRIDLDMLTTLASYVGVAFANADSYRQLQDAQQQLVEREKLAALGSLVAGVAHELNTPIGNSLVIASTLEAKTGDIEVRHAGNGLRRSDLSHFIEAAREASMLLMRSLHNAAELVNSFKQVAVDQASAKRRQFNLHQASAEIVTTMKNQIRKAGHRMTLEMPDDITMDSFPGPYGQVIINLINNALLHAFDGREGGMMRLSAVRAGTDSVRVVFEDDGCGITPEHQARIFDPFFTTKLGQGGNGLGLSITYNIVSSLLGGAIRVDSTVGVGTRFTMELPLQAALNGD
ncbi:two-component regulator propeller domain-containing protein [Duganella sp. Leaf126]|uniref:two-component regulator propeller domain-containing protein n=1 Tax=Duganella sp. Leaf126 TaxID=1736266 RepID=UPI001E58728F|nr:two-component regulator propeller domain-containing protein [Duganella sp. Leaf126]